jgi:hypothetical protein
MGNHFKFAWLCIRHAWRGCWTKANGSAAAILGGAILTVVLFSSRDWLQELNLIEAPTSVPGTAAFTLASAVASVVLAFLVIFAGRLVLAPSRLYWEQHTRAETLEAELTAANADPDDGPNWPIHELFSYLEPEVLDRPKDALWQKAGDEIRDTFSLGRLRVWGRPSETHLGKWIGERAALRLIDKKYWEKAYFTYMFFDASAHDQTQVYADRDTGRPAYTDLQVNRAEVLKLWPGEPDDLAENYPNVRVADAPVVIQLFDGSERAKLIALLAGNVLRSWARVSADHTPSDLVQIDGLIWNTHRFLFIPKAKDGEGTINQTYLRPKGGHNSSHYDICLNYAQLKRVWPNLSMYRTKCDVR